MSTLSPSISTPTVVAAPESTNDSTAKPTSNSRWDQLKQPPYQIDQQVKFLHLSAEVETLLQQLQSLKQQRLAIHSDSSAKNQ